jgi:chromosome segregation protein
VRLKSITLHGFKSFCNRTDVPLGQGITAIVGPNGCGKSNVSDGIRWVLGEPNVRNLRGENILDVIFKGSGSAKPAGFAEVNLLIDNDDHALPVETGEVSIARRVYRSGDSDFLINNHPCRLKDIRNLFLGTGLGSHGYSVIEREMVDAVLSDRDDQRRLFFEEAAGISRYKLQRREAMRKLEATEQDLTRIADIVREIEREVRSLARQVGKARRHQRLMDEIRDLEVALALRRWTDLERAHEECTSERDTWADRRQRMQTELSRREAEIETHRIRQTEKERLLEEARSTRESLLSEQAASREENSVLSTKIQGWEQKEVELARRIREESDREISLRRRAGERAPERAGLAAEFGKHQRSVEAATAALHETEDRLRQARAEAARLAQLRMDQLLTQTREGKELESLDGMIEQQEVRRSALQVHRDGLLEKAAELGSKLAGLDEEVSILAKRLAEIAAQRAEISASRSVLEADREELRQQREDAARRRASIESRLSLLREQRARHEGFGLGVRHLLERRAPLPGVVGVVGDLLTPAAGTADSVVESLLADAVQWVVVENEAAAMAAAESLRDEGHGGVTFFPLEENGDRSGDLAHWRGSLPLDGPKEIAPLIRFLLGRVRPAGSREEARRGARAAGPLLRYLSPEGEIYASEGWIRTTGGSGPDREIVERMGEIPRLEESLFRLEQEERDVRERLSAREERIRKQAEALASLDDEAAGASERHHRLERDLSERRVERGLLLEEQERVSSEIENLVASIGRLQSDRKRIEGLLGLYDQSGREAEERHQAAKAAEEEVSRNRDGAFEELSGVRTEAVRLENALREVETAVARDVEEADRLAAAILQWNEESDQTAKLRIEASEKQKSLAARGIEIEHHLAEVERLLDRRRLERDEEQTYLAVHDQELRELRGELTGLQERLHGDQVREIEIRSEMDRLRERIQQEFNVDLIAEARRALEPQPPAPEAGEPKRRRRRAKAAPEEAAAGDAASSSSADLDRLVEEEMPEGDDAAEGDAPDDAGGPAGPLSEEEQRKQIADLREKLLSLGLVNFLAVDEYSKQKERLLFHRQQQDDLTRARNDLLQAIQRINETAGAMFRETFDAARGHFRNTFEFLFPGGEADISLTGEDPLEAAIEITARPRGKKLEAIRLLSTGERALTAIALLFGLYLVRPSPFCVLDELDAPLDDANIGRFVTLLRHFSERTQFVVITHNKRTMEASDRLYGVTMQQAGISRIVSVRLETDGELAAEIAEADAGAAPEGVREG